MRDAFLGDGAVGDAFRAGDVIVELAEKCYSEAVALESSYPKVLVVITNHLRKILSANIKAYRKAEGMSQEVFAASCGLHRTYIGSVERGERNVTLATLQQLSDAMGVSAADLLTAPSKKGAKH